MLVKELSILYVEDDRETQEHIAMLLEDEVGDLYQAYDGTEGLALYKKHPIDIVISDIHMPTMNGLDMVAQIKEYDSEQNVILISAFDDRETLLRSIELGIDYFLPKPIDMQLLFEYLRNIVQRKREKEQLLALAHHDSLTKLLNRYSFERALESSLSRAKRHDESVALLFIDLDNFKAVNDTYSHAAGDALLQSVAQRVSKILRTEDIFARLSGDEFAILIEKVEDISRLGNIAQKILDTIVAPVAFMSHTISVGCSIGIALYPEDAKTPNELINRADHAMYSVKHKEKNGYAFYAKEYAMQTATLPTPFTAALEEKLKEILTKTDSSQKMQLISEKLLKEVENLTSDITVIADDCYWDSHEQFCHYKGKIIPMGLKERRLLALLFEHAEHIVHYSTITESIWDEIYLEDMSKMKTLIKQLRKKLPYDIIKNVFGVGYRLTVEELNEDEQ